MQRWGIITAAFYAVVLTIFLFPIGALLMGVEYFEALSNLFDPAAWDDGLIFVWLLIALFVAAQAILLFVSVDTSRKRLKPRRKLAASVASTSFAVGFMSIAILLNIVVAISGDDVFDWEWFWLIVPGLWLFWAIVFFLYRQRVSDRLDRTIGWLLNGSVLQLLIAVPTHILVRHRDDCCAPMISGYGIATGVALMLMAFGPSVVFLYQKRLQGYGRGVELPLLARWPVKTVVATLLISAVALFAFTSREPEVTGQGTPPATAVQSSPID